MTREGAPLRLAVVAALQPLPIARGVLERSEAGRLQRLAPPTARTADTRDDGGGANDPPEDERTGAGAPPVLAGRGHGVFRWPVMRRS